MRRFLSTIVLSCVLATCFSPAWHLAPALAQRKTNKAAKVTPAALASQRGADTITEAQLRDYLSFIASDEMEGRDTPSRGLDTTAKFLALNLDRWGFKPAGDEGSYLQRIDLQRNRADSGQTNVEYAGRTLVAGTDYIPVGGSGNVSGQLDRKRTRLNSS